MPTVLCQEESLGALLECECRQVNNSLQDALFNLLLFALLIARSPDAGATRS